MAYKITNLELATTNLPDGTVVTADLANGAVTAAKAKVWSSTEQTATGSAQAIAHTLAVVPSIVMICVTETGGEAYDIAEGTHTSSNINATITSGVKFKVFAWA